MQLNEQDWRPITFQGVTFPATLMGISVLEPILDIKDEDLGDWLWRLPICCGVTKTTSAARCTRCAQQALDLMLENRQRVLDGIQERLAPHGFDADSTYRDWILVLQRIVEISASTNGDCSWSAPLNEQDPIQNAQDAKNFLRNLERARDNLIEDERNQRRQGNDHKNGEGG